MIERKRYIELCQKNAVYHNSVIVYYQGVKYYPISYLMWFDKKGNVQNTAILHSIKSRSYMQVKLLDVWENDHGQKNNNNSD